MAEPYWSDDSIELYHGDCREITKWLDADVLVTDPPYGMSYESNFNRDSRNTKLGRAVTADETTMARDRVLTLWGDRPAVVFGRWNCPRPAATRARLIWDRGYHGMGDLSFPWGPSDEEVYVLGEGFTGSRTSSVLRVHALMSGSHERPDHPTPKPIPLMEALVAKCPRGVVADPFTGSGSTLIAARNLGRRAIGVEVEERYCEIAAKRLAQGVLEVTDT